MNNNVPIIYYHSVAPSKNQKWFRSYLTLELKYFETQLKYFKKNKFESLFINEYFELREIKNKKYFCLTFDDGYLDNYIYVFPLLKKYEFKATIFVNPVFVEPNNMIRNTLEDYWSNKKTYNNIEKWGFMSWDEMALMENSGFIDIQSHTMSHTKYFTSDHIVDFHHPGYDCLYPVINKFPTYAHSYIGNENFSNLIPFGYPIFESESAIVAKKFTISDEFIDFCCSEYKKRILDDYKYDLKEFRKFIDPVYLEFIKDNKLIVNIESEDEYCNRVENELKNSKLIIEEKLNKKVDFLCWPHGDNNDFAHKTALKVKYKATTTGNGKYSTIKYGSDRIPERIGLSSCKNSVNLTSLKTKYKIKSYMNYYPYNIMNKYYLKFRYGVKL